MTLLIEYKPHSDDDITSIYQEINKLMKSSKHKTFVATGRCKTYRGGLSTDFIISCNKQRNAVIKTVNIKNLNNV